jgi:hypothetical protein
VKTSPTVFGCVFVLFFSWVSVGRAQQQPTSPPSDPPADQSQQTPPPATPPGAPPAEPSPLTPPQNPPPATTPPEQAPLAQPRIGIRQPPPPLPKVPDIRQPGETGYWIGLSGWLPTQTPTIDKGKGSAFTQQSLTKLQGKPKVAPGAEVGIAVGLHNALRLSYFQSRAAGSLTNTVDKQLWSKLYPAGELASTDYKLQNFKLSFEYLTWPYPVESRRFRLKSLWQVQYTSIRTVFDLPQRSLVDSNGLPLADSSGNPLSYAAEGTRYFISPTLGLGATEYVSRNFRLEANASGFGIPHHTAIWDADASANIRFGHFELKLGAKAFHFKTSTKSEFYVKSTMASAFVGLRWYSE